jgi:hypothetical protein
MPKGGLDEQHRSRDSFAMCTPEFRFVVENSPVPVSPIIRFIYIKFASEELNKYVGAVEN